MQVTEDDFEKAAQNAALHMHVMPRIDSQPQNTAHEKRLVLPRDASSRNTMQTREMGEEGLQEQNRQYIRDFGNTKRIQYTFFKITISEKAGFIKLALSRAVSVYAEEV
jgi:hypothetical protein